MQLHLMTCVYLNTNVHHSILPIFFFFFSLRIDHAYILYTVNENTFLKTLIFLYDDNLMRGFPESQHWLQGGPWLHKSVSGESATIVSGNSGNYTYA